MPIRKNEPDAGGEFGRDGPVLKEPDFREGLELPDQEFGSHLVRTPMSVALTAPAELLVQYAPTPTYGWSAAAFGTHRSTVLTLQRLPEATT